MTQEEIAKVKAMSREQRRLHFKPMFMSGKITFKQYEAIMNIGDDWVSDLAKEFGGGVIETKPLSQIAKDLSSG